MSDVWEMVEGGGVQLSVQRSGDGAGTVSGPGIDCGSDCAERYEPGTVVTLTATPGADSSFVHWEGACSGSMTTCTVTMDDATSVTARFTHRPVLEVSKTGTGQGTVTSAPAGISCGSTCSAAFDLGTQVTLTADPGAASTFSGWGGDCSGNAQTCTLTMDGPKSVTATFAAWPTLTVAIAGQGTGTVAGSGISCPGDCEEAFAPSTVVVLAATPEAGSVFAGWSGDCPADACTLTMDGPRSVTATFELASAPRLVGGARLRGP